ncbi:MAG: hypothetical protein QM739_05705 [Propionivibrio sp.]
MLKTFFGKAFGSAGSEGEVSAHHSSAAFQLARIRMLIEFFPIGKKLRYYPEFKQDIVFDTLILGYCVNGGYVYSTDAIDRDAEGNPTVFRFGENDQRTPVAALKLFQLLVPDTSHLEMKLDYHRRAQIGRGKQFNKGNYISLISNAGGKGVSTVDTEVAKQVNLPDGPYSHMNMVLLTPELSTLSVSDQRKKFRAKITAPVTLHAPEAGRALPCALVDMSEDEVRMRVREHGAVMPELRRGDGVIIEADLGEAERHYTIKGNVIRRSPETCVLQLEGQIRDGRYCSFSPLDLLELKAGLLNYGK